MTYFNGTNQSDEFIGTDNDDVIAGGNGDDTLSGGAGNDTIEGGNGADALDGSEGDDTVSGGNGGDTLDGGSGSDVVNGNRGDDVLRHDVFLNIGDYDLYYGGSGSDRLIVRLTQAQLDELLSTQALVDFQTVAGTSALFDFSNYNLSYSFNLRISQIESISFDLITNPISTIIGNTGLGTLTISGDVTATGDTTLNGTIVGGTFTSDDGIIGKQDGSDGSAVVSGVWNVGATGGNLYVGFGGQGELLVTDGGRVNIFSGTDDIDVPGDGRDMVVGWSDGTTAGVGKVILEGNSSKLSVSGVDATMVIGLDGGTGSMLVSAGAQLETRALQIGSNGGTGDLLVTGEGSSIVIAGQYSQPHDPFDVDLNIGLNGGEGRLTVADGGVVSVVGDGSRIRVGGSYGNPSLDATAELFIDGDGSKVELIGGEGLNKLSIGQYHNGLVRLTNGSSLSISSGNSNYAPINLGEGGTGKLEILSGSQVVVDGLDNPIYGGANGHFGGEGHILVSGAGSLLAFGSLAPGGTGSLLQVTAQEFGQASLTIEDGAEVRTDTLIVGYNSFLFGETGTLNANLVRFEGGEMGKTDVVGTFTINGDIGFQQHFYTPETTSFTINVDVDGRSDGEYDVTQVSGAASFYTPGLIKFEFTEDFSPIAGDEFEFFRASELNEQSFSSISYVVTGLGADLQSTLIVSDTSLRLVVLSDGVSDSGVDLFLGSDRNDVFDGGAGNDVIRAGGGINTFTGGADDDIFVFDGEANTVITDFQAGDGSDDMIDLSIYYSGLQQLIDHSTQGVSGVEIYYGDDSVITLTGVNIVDLHTSDFIL